MSNLISFTMIKQLLMQFDCCYWVPIHKCHIINVRKVEILTTFSWNVITLVYSSPLLHLYAHARLWKPFTYLICVQNFTVSLWYLIWLSFFLKWFCLPSAAALKHPRTPPTNPSVDFPSGDSEHPSKRTRPMGNDEVVGYVKDYCIEIEMPAFLLLCSSSDLYFLYAGKSSCECSSCVIPRACTQSDFQCTRWPAQDSCTDFEPRIISYEHGFSSNPTDSTSRLVLQLDIFFLYLI